MKMMSLKKGKWLERIPYLVACVFVLGVILIITYQKGMNVETVIVELFVCICSFQIAKHTREEIMLSCTLKEFQEYKKLVEDVLDYMVSYLSQVYSIYFNDDDIDSIRELGIDYHKKYLLCFRNALIKYYECRYVGCDNNDCFSLKYAKIHRHVFDMATLLISSLVKYPIINPTLPGFKYATAIFLEKVLENFMGKFKGVGIRKRENVSIREQLYYAYYISEQELQNYIEMLIINKYSISKK